MTMPTLIERAHHDEVGSRPTPDRPRRRRFTAECKLAILAEYDRLEANGEKGALLRREGAAHVASGGVAAGSGRRDPAPPRTEAGASSGPRASGDAALTKANNKVARLEAELAKNGLALEIMGEVSGIG